MAYLIDEFDGINLPLYNPQQQDDTAPVDSALLDSVGGVFDYYGTAPRLARRQQIEITGIYLGRTAYLTDEAGNRLVDEAGNYLIAGDAENRLRAQLQALRAKTGVRGPLWRTRQDDGAREWITARLLRVTHGKRQEEMAVMATVTCLWESMHTAWRAEMATTTAGSAVDGIALGINVSNGGDVTVYDATLTITRTSGTITTMVVIGPNIALSWTGSLASGSLVIDCGAQTVEAAGADSYSGFELDTGHSARGWLPLETGITPLVITVTGGNATVTVTHYNQFR